MRAGFAIGVAAFGLAAWADGALAGAIISVPSTPSDYFTEAIAQAPLSYLPSGWDQISPVSDVTTGQVGTPFATITSPVTAVYFSTSLQTLSLSGTPGELSATGNAKATADLLNGSLHASAGVTSQGPLWGSYGFSAAGAAEFGDTLYFTNQSAGPSTVTTINFSVHLDGVLEGASTGSGLASAQLFAAVGVPFDYGSAGYPGGFDPATNNIVSTGGVLETYYGQPGPINKTFTSSFSFIGPSAAAGIYMWLDAASQYYYSDFGQTASLSFNNVPAGVSFTSASGDFLTTAVPEPSTWTMMLLGSAGLGYAGFRRGQRAKAPSVA